MKSEILGIQAPPKDCTDKKCPFHGDLTVKKELFKGKIVKKDVSRSATIEWFKPLFVPKYERYEVRRYRLRTHNPSCISAQVGDEVLVAKTRPLSKTKHNVIIQVSKSASSSNQLSFAQSSEGNLKRNVDAAHTAKKSNKATKNRSDVGTKTEKTGMTHERS
ncbi:30S ribosomal protein S17 [Candidatus Woesearchaeota archaeon]|nr:30S ribosomal protein S17 [Candidatus Woesearchaeota archaeon]